MAGGSGITPIFQTMMEIAAMKDEKIELVLLFANKTEEDIVLRKEIESTGGRIKIHYILDVANEDWKHYKGYITHEILREICPLDDPATIYIHCGPPPMNKFIRTLFSEYYPNSVLFKY